MGIDYNGGLGRAMARTVAQVAGYFQTCAEITS